jgi:hypothetical protein
LDEMVCIAGVAALQNHFDAAKHLPGTPRIDDLATLNFHLNAKVALYSGNRVNRDSFTHMSSSPS